MAIELYGQGGVCRLQPVAEGTATTKPGMSVAELLEKHHDGDFLRAIAEAVWQLIMETDVEGVARRGPAQAGGGPQDLAQWLPRPRPRHPARHIEGRPHEAFQRKPWDKRSAPGDGRRRHLLSVAR